MQLNLYELDFEPHPLYHVSPKTFDMPSYEMVDDARNWSHTHHNSVLGLWTSTYPEMCSAFGPLTYEVHLKDQPIKRLGLSYEEWCKLGMHTLDYHQQFVTLRKHILENEIVDIIYIADATKSVSEVIIVDFDVIDKLTVVDGVKNKAYKMLPTLKATVISEDVINRCKLSYQSGIN